MNLFKIGVSNWILKFVNQTVEIKTISEEQITHTADGKIRIVLTDVTFKTNLIDLFKKGNNVEHVSQSFQLRNGFETKTYDIIYEYDNLKISDITYKSISDNLTVTECVIILVS